MPPRRDRGPWEEALTLGAQEEPWQDVSELVDDPAAREARRRELPEGADAPDPALARRSFLGLMGATAALFGLGGCSRGPRERIVPYVSQPPEARPGVASHYATAMELDGYATGLLVESHEGRPTKIEGNPEHPASLGGSGAFEQAALLGLYDPSRARAILHGPNVSTWGAFVAALTSPRPPAKELHLVMEPTSSPLAAALVDQVRATVPGAVFHFYAPFSRRASWEAAARVLGRPLEGIYDLRRADVVVSLDSDLLGSGPFHLAYARSFADRRRVRDAAGSMNRLYVVEPTLTVTGMSADHRLRVRPSEVRAVAAALWRSVRGEAGGGPHEAWAAAVAKDLRAHEGAALVVAGDHQPWEVHALALAVNEALGAHEKTVRYVVPSVVDAGEDSHDLRGLTRAIDRGSVGALVILGGNPAYTADADIELARRIRSVPLTAYLGAHENETREACAWMVPRAHFLESWGDARALDGTVSIVQPLIQPLFGGHTVEEVLAALVGGRERSPHELVRDHWRARRPEGFDAFWEDALRHGVIPGTAASSEPVRVGSEALRAAEAPAPGRQGTEIAIRPDARVHDGAFAGNGWLRELPDPTTKLTWENAAVVSPRTAARLGLATGDVVQLTVRGRETRVPVVVLPGHADEVIVLSAGYGRAGADALGGSLGVDAFALRDGAARDFDLVSIAKTSETRPLPITQLHGRMEGRPIALSATLDEYRKDPRLARRHEHPNAKLYQLRPAAKTQWAMTLDLNACTGCSACVVACQAENNVPVVGKENVEKGREMHWLRVDRYFTGDAEDPSVVAEPMMCQHCEKAPCEYVCPVGATVHGADGLNEMVYNRCVGTRFCSNNCPYKVRRFNWFDFRRGQADVVSLAMNPDVTVRERGVMEKCTYCVQRIREAEIAARRDGRELRDGDVVTACQQACPSRAIVFGSLADPTSEVLRLREDDRAFSVLHELGTIPRTKYLAKLTNPNPEL